MKLFTKAILTKLAKNGAATRDAQAAGKPEPDHKPVLKIFNPTGAATWLITESDPNNPDFLFGLCDLGMGSPELGSVSASELASVRGRLGLPLERDLLRFATKSEAERWVADLSMRWLAVRETRAVESDDPVNYAIIDNQLKEVTK